MNLEKRLLEKFDKINKAYFETEMGMKFLKVEVNIRDLDSITEISREISNYLDEIDKTDDVYYLDVFSPGTDENFEPNESNKHIGEDVQIELTRHVKDMNEFIGELLEADDERIIIRWNAKGQFRKQEIAIDNIKSIKKYIKVKKGKR